MGIEVITSKDWERLKQDLMALEGLFPYNSRFTPKKKKDLYSMPTAFGLAYFDDKGRAMGEIVGLSAKDAYDLKAEGLDGYSESEDALYVMSIAVALQMQRQGIGKQMTGQIIELAKERGYRSLIEHVQDCAPNLVLNLGATMVRRDIIGGKPAALYKLSLLH